MPIDYTYERFEDLELPHPLTAEAATSAARQNGLAAADVVFRAGGGTDAERNALTWLLATYVPQPYATRTNHQILPLTAASVGQVVLAYGAGKRATATLVGRGLPTGPEPPHRDPAQLGQWLKDTYALAAISGAWSADQLAKLYEALRRVPAADHPALRGVEIQRVNVLRSDDGHNKGSFSYDRGPWTGSPGMLKLADAIFEEDDIGFYGGLTSPACPPSVRGILHEVGHAVESVACRYDSRDNAARVVESIGGPRYPAPQRVPENRVTDAIQLRTDNKALNELATGLASGAPITQFNALADTIEKLQGWITAARDGTYQPEEAFAEVKAEVTGTLTLDQWRSYRQEIVRWCDAQISEARWRRTYVTPQGRPITPCLRDFVQFVHNGGVARNLTTYAETSFGELFAEAYSFWIADPDAVARHDARLRTYFDEGRYRQGN